MTVNELIVKLQGLPKESKIKLAEHRKHCTKCKEMVLQKRAEKYNHKSRCGKKFPTRYKLAAHLTMLQSPTPGIYCIGKFYELCPWVDDNVTILKLPI
jgi:hypothetical protein